MEPWDDNSPHWPIHMNFIFLWEQNHLLLKWGILYRQARPKESEETLFQLVLPAAQRGCSEGMPQSSQLSRPGTHAWSHAWLVLLALHGCSDKGTHWKVPPMPCLQCQAAQSPPKISWPQNSLELVHLNYLCLEPGKGLEENVLVVTDHFTRYAQAYVTRAQTAQTTAKTPWDKFIVNYGLPEKILSDQVQNFESQLVADLYMLMGMQKIWTSPYHPQTNGQYEMFNSTLISMLGMLSPEKKSGWKNHIGISVHTYNCTQNSAMGFSPYYLMYRRQPHLPIDITLCLTPQNTTALNTSKFAQK